MTIRDMRDILKADVLLGQDNLDREVLSACGSDLMSDVLAFVKEKAVLLTGMTNPQVIRTAEMADIVAVIFVRGKAPTGDVLEMAKECDIPVLCCSLTLYDACGVLYQNGLQGGSRPIG